MASLIRDGAVVDDRWLPAAADGEPVPGQILTLQQWLEAGRPAGAGVQLEPGDDCRVLFDQLPVIDLIVVHFPVFTDGRGFSAGRQLRERGYRGELRARGDFLPDQLHYLRRCGFNAFALADEARLQAGLARLEVFSDSYQSSVDQPLPLFRRRA
jgi:uncharacterized protein (DUF934 family)